MLTTKQKQLLKRAVLYPSMVITEMFVCFLLPFLWLLLIMIDDLVLQGQELFTVGFYAMPVLVFILLIILMVQGLYIQRATRKEDWMEMVKMAKGKLEDPETNMLLEKAANVGFLAASLMTPEGFYAGARMAAEARLLKRMKAIRNTAIQMCILFREKVPNRIPYMLALIFVPVIILVGLYGFRYIDTIQTNRADAQRTADVVYHIEDVLDTTCADTYIQDPLAKFDRIGYTITADLYDEDMITYESSEIELSVNNEGQIQSVDYRLGVNVLDTKENNLTRMQQELDLLYGLLMETKVEMTSANYYVKPFFPQEIIDKFMDHSYYEDFTGEYLDSFSVGFITEEEENYELYGETYFYFMMEDD